MAKTMIRVAGRPFHINVAALSNSSKYRCQFHEKHEWLGRTWGFVGSNKNYANKERGEIYDWFKEMVEKHTPADESGAQVLEEVVSQLEEDFEEVHVES